MLHYNSFETEICNYANMTVNHKIGHQNTSNIQKYIYIRFNFNVFPCCNKNIQCSSVFYFLIIPHNPFENNRRLCVRLDLHECLVRRQSRPLMIHTNEDIVTWPTNDINDCFDLYAAGTTLCDYCLLRYFCFTTAEWRLGRVTSPRRLHQMVRLSLFIARYELEHKKRRLVRQQLRYTVRCNFFKQYV